MMTLPIHAPATAAPVLVRDLSFRYDLDEAVEHLAMPEERPPALEDITFTLTPGTLTLVTGPSGCGKSTLLKVLNGLIPHLWSGQLTGDFHLHGHDARELSQAQIGRASGSVFQNPRSQFFTTTVVQELAFGPENAGEERAAIAHAVQDSAEVFHLGDLLPRRLDQLSGGELQRVACAVAAAGNRRLLLLDEPTSNLSTGAVDELAEILADLKMRGWTLLVAEHRLHFLRNLADHVLLMEGGRVRETFTGEEFFQIDEGECAAAGLRTLRPPRPPRRLREERCEAGDPVLETGVSVRNLRFSYGSTRVLDVEALDLPAGAVTILTGDNGIGKTTLARVLVGLEEAERGSRITFDGHKVRARARSARSALVMQDVNRQLFAPSVVEEVALGNDTVSEEDAAGLLAAFDLDDLAQRHPMSLSGGQKQRLVVAAAVASQARLYVFDEPTSGVDRRHLTAVAARLRSLAASGAVVLVISHDPEFTCEVADRECHLAAGHATGASAHTWTLEATVTASPKEETHD